MTKLVDVIIKFIEESDITDLTCEEGFTFTRYYVSLKKRKFFSKKLYASFCGRSSHLLFSLRINGVDLENSLCQIDSKVIVKHLKEKVKTKEKLDAKMLEKKLIKSFLSGGVYMNDKDILSTIFEVAWFWRDGFDSHEHTVAFFKDKPSIKQLGMLGLKKKVARKLWLNGRVDVKLQDTVFLLEQPLNGLGSKEIVRAKSKWEGI